MEPTLIICSPVGKGAWPVGFRKSQCLACQQAIWLRNSDQRGLVALCQRCYEVSRNGRSQLAITKRLNVLAGLGKVQIDLAPEGG